MIAEYKEWVLELNDVTNIVVIIGVIVAIGTLISHIITARAVARQTAWNSFFDDFENINNYITTNNNSTSGETDLITMPYPKLRSGTENVSLIFHHINLIFRFWINIKLLNKGEVEGFERWTKVVFFNWILSNKNLSYDLVIILDFKDAYPDKFIKWITNLTDYQVVKRKVAENIE